jgi:hypothetical protein
MQLGEPILHLQYLDENEKVLFESREMTANTIGSAVGMMIAVAQSFELCQERRIALRRSVRRYVAEGLTELIGVVRRIAIALDIPESELLDGLSGSKALGRPDIKENVQGD